MSGSLALTAFKALLVVIPWVIQTVRDGHIRTASQEEVLTALKSHLQARVNRAKQMRDDETMGDPYAK